MSRNPRRDSDWSRLNGSSVNNSEFSVGFQFEQGNVVLAGISEVDEGEASRSTIDKGQGTVLPVSSRYGRINYEVSTFHYILIWGGHTYRKTRQLQTTVTAWTFCFLCVSFVFPCVPFVIVMIWMGWVWRLCRGCVVAVWDQWQVVEEGNHGGKECCGSF